MGTGMIEQFALVFIGGLLATLLWLIPLRWLAPRIGLIDHPEGRKEHDQPTPIVGGLAIILGGVTGLGLLALREGAHAVWAVLVLHRGFLFGATLLVAVGLWDDRKPIAARYKLLMQVIACIVAVLVDKAYVGDILISADLLVLTLGPLVIPFTVLVMLTVTNAINMIDGADGLAGGLMMVALAIMAKALTAAGWGSAILIFGLMGALSGFLLTNFPLRANRPATVFLGDCGSLLLGFALAYLAINLSALPNRVFKPSMALWLFFLPASDAIWLYLRRAWFGRAPFAPGRDHIHHLLMSRFKPREVTWILVGASALLSGGAYASERLGAPSYILIVGWIALFFLYGYVTHRAWKHAWVKSRAKALAAHVTATRVI